MANINIIDIKPTGVELFADSESFMSYLNDNEIAQILGGMADASTVSNSCASGQCNYTSHQAEAY